MDKIGWFVVLKKHYNEKKHYTKHVYSWVSRERPCLEFLIDNKWSAGFTCRKCSHNKYVKCKKWHHKRCASCMYDESAHSHQTSLWLALEQIAELLRSSRASSHFVEPGGVEPPSKQGRTGTSTCLFRDWFSTWGWPWTAHLKLSSLEFRARRRTLP